MDEFGSYRCILFSAQEKSLIDWCKKMCSIKLMGFWFASGGGGGGWWRRQRRRRQRQQWRLLTNTHMLIELEWLKRRMVKRRTGKRFPFKMQISPIFVFNEKSKLKVSSVRFPFYQWHRRSFSTFFPVLICTHFSSSSRSFALYFVSPRT